jgi:hypothetical protein
MTAFIPFIVLVVGFALPPLLTGKSIPVFLVGIVSGLVNIFLAKINPKTGEVLSKMRRFLIAPCRALKISMTGREERPTIPWTHLFPFFRPTQKPAD